MEHDLRRKFLKYIDKNELFNQQATLIVGVSGGKDSMVLVDLLVNYGVSFTVAHCNFHLRGNDSNMDMALVQEWCSEKKIPFIYKNFDTISFAENNKISVEMAARELRYKWFNNLMHNKNANAICVAHHLNDQVETFFLNLARGTGLKGLTGMQAQNKQIIRPLLFATRKEIDEYAHKHKIPFRKDKSNDDTTIKRNYLRHEVIPTFDRLNPSFLATMNENIRNLQGIMQFIDTQFNQMSKNLITRENQITIINIPTDTQRTIFIDFLIYFFAQQGIRFSVTQIKNIVESSHGAQIKFDKFLLTKNRSQLILSLVYPEILAEQTINVLPAEVKFGKYSFLFREIQLPKTLEISKIENEVWVDAAKFTFPLTIRQWKPGDKMRPLGMKGEKKIKKILTDNKISSLDRRVYPVVCNQHKIIWLPLLRVSNDVKIDSNTTRVIAISVKK